MSASRMLSGKLLEPTTTVPPLAVSPFSGSLLPELSEEPQPVRAAAATTSRDTAYVAFVLVLLAWVTLVIQTCAWAVGGRKAWRDDDPIEPSNAPSRHE